MNINKFTQKSIEAVNQCEKIAYDYGNQEIDQEHFLYSLMTIDDSLIANLIEKMQINKEAFISNIETLLSQKTKVSGNVQLYVSNDLNKVLINAEDEAKRMGDAYVSVEHLMLAMIASPNKQIKQLFKTYGITRDSFLSVLATVRGNQSVTSDNPEATYDTLAKYGQDLVEKAKSGKLDPVIGRDNEIRNVIRILSRKTKNNPVLIGEPGVGKTAVVEGLAERIVRGDVPEGLKDKKIFALDMGALEGQNTIVPNRCLCAALKLSILSSPKSVLDFREDNLSMCVMAAHLLTIFLRQVYHQKTIYQWLFLRHNHPQ